MIKTKEACIILNTKGKDTEYCLKGGDPSYYGENVKILKNLEKETGELCEFEHDWGWSRCIMDDLGLVAGDDGRVSARTSTYSANIGAFN